MEISKLKELLDLIGIPVAYRRFKKTTSPPYVIFFKEGEGVDGSDFANEILTEEYVIELYCEDKSIELEDQISTLLSNHGIKYTSYETYVEDEDLIATIYTFETISKNRR